MWQAPSVSPRISDPAIRWSRSCAIPARATPASCSIRISCAPRTCRSPTGSTVVEAMDAIFRTDPYTQSCEATVLRADETGIRLDRTVFYPMGGGQPGDHGVLRLADGSVIPIRDTVKGTGPDDILHLTGPGVTLP